MIYIYVCVYTYMYAVVHPEVQVQVEPIRELSNISLKYIQYSTVHTVRVVVLICRICNVSVWFLTLVRVLAGTSFSFYFHSLSGMNTCA